jgi:hypothetical protein
MKRRQNNMAGLAQENGFGSAFFHWLLRFSKKGTGTSNKYL